MGEAGPGKGQKRRPEQREGSNVGVGGRGAQQGRVILSRTAKKLSHRMEIFADCVIV